MSKVENIISLLLNADGFEYIKRELTRMPVEAETDSDFITSLKTLLGSVETLRNCVAHNRASSQRMMKSYETARDTLNSKFDEFLKPFLVES
jgi:hypothetical protein